LNIFREGWLQAKDIKIMRDTILVPTIKWEIKDNDIAYIQLYQFSETASYDFAKTANEILNSDARKIIFDVRDNPGGYLEVSQDIASWFLTRGKVVAIEDFGNGKNKKEYKSSGLAKFADYPMVILINEGSASASEIFAGALRDNNNVKLIGQKSFGKGSVQELQDLVGGSTIKVTIAKWLTPNGTTINDKGLEPDIKVDYTEEDVKAGKDPQLDKAIEIIKGL
jgi:carboxyl-terminal processing protease